MITAREARDLLRYDPETGFLYWLVDRGIGTNAGDRAGSFSKSRGYIRIKINYGEYLAHRVIWLIVRGEWPNQIDHINHNRIDNRLINLRSVDRFKNHQNKKMMANNKSGFSGVYWNKNDKIWQAGVQFNGARENLGRFNDWFDAVCAVKSAQNKYGFHKNHGLAVSEG